MTTQERTDAIITHLDKMIIKIDLGFDYNTMLIENYGYSFAFRFCFSQNLRKGGVSSSTVINHKCSFGELNLFLFFFERGQNIKIKL